MILDLRHSLIGDLFELHSRSVFVIFVFFVVNIPGQFFAFLYG